MATSMATYDKEIRERLGEDSVKAILDEVTRGRIDISKMSDIAAGLDTGELTIKTFLRFT